MGSNKSTLSKSEIKALQDAEHGDPFSILGAHFIKKRNETDLVIRTFQPHAEKVEVVKADGEHTELPQVGDTGLFEKVWKKVDKIDPYELRIVPREGETYQLPDPYTYGSLIDEYTLQLWGEGSHYKAYEFMGAHIKDIDGVVGTHFVVAAPAASRVSVVGSFNDWDGRRHPMRKYVEQGIWELFIPGVGEGDLYKFEIKSDEYDLPFLKSDPYGYWCELRPKNASVVTRIDNYKWRDKTWMDNRGKKFNEPLAIYEVHLGSWKKKQAEQGTEDHNSFYSYRELADELIPYVKDMGYTHIEMLPLAEHPYDPSWGYQITGYFAPTSRFGSPQDLMYFIDKCHQNDIGVIMDWVPAHFAKDENGLRFFDGTHLYEHADPRQGEHKDWGTHIFNFGRTEVINFLLSNAVFWCEKYHIDGIRIDAVASMLYLDYAREGDDWIPNKYGGRENLEAISLLKRTNEILNEEFPGITTFAEESTSWPMVSKPTYIGGLGFDYKWNMGWMNDTLKYFEVDPVFRKYHHNQLTFSMIYAFTENFLLPLSHDEVVHMKRSMVSKMPGDDWQKFANLRLLYTYKYAHPGKKLLFMGGEFAQWSEWNDEQQLDWGLLQYERHKGMHTLVRDLNTVYKEEKPLHEVDFEWNGFQWVDFSNMDNSILAFLRFAEDRNDFVLCVFNFTPQVHENYALGVPHSGSYRIILDSDSEFYGGSNYGNDELHAVEEPWQEQPAKLKVNLPPLAGLLIKPY